MTLRTAVRFGDFSKNISKPLDRKLRFSKEIAKDLVKNSYRFILSSLMVVIFNQTDKIMLKQILNETETGYYSIAANLCNMWPIFLMAIITSANPIIMEAKKMTKKYTKKEFVNAMLELFM